MTRTISLIMCACGCGQVGKDLLMTYDEDADKYYVSIFHMTEDQQDALVRQYELEDVYAD